MIDVRSIGQHLGRSRHENGWVKRVGKRVKKWRGYYHVYVEQPDGTEKRMRRKVTLGDCADIPTKGEAEDRLQEHIRLARGQRITSGGATVAALCDEYVRMRKGDWSEANQKTVQSVFDKLIKPVIGAMEVKQVAAVDLKALMNGLTDRTWKTPKGNARSGVSLSYAKKARSYLRGVFDYAVSQSLIPRNPARDSVVMLKVPLGARKPSKKYLEPEDLPVLLAKLGAEDHIVIHMALMCALRPNEIYALRRDDVGDGFIRIDESLDRKRNVKDPKTESSKANVFMPPILQRDLSDWLRIHPGKAVDLIFPNRDGKPRNRHNELNRMLKPAAKRAGLGNVTFQILRRTFSTLAQMKLGLKDIQAQMRHSSPNMTAGTYMQSIPARQQHAMIAFEELMFGGTARTVAAGESIQ